MNFSWEKLELADFDAAVVASCKGVEGIVADGDRDVRPDWCREARRASFLYLWRYILSLASRSCRTILSLKSEALLPAFLPCGYDVDLVAKDIRQIVGLCREHPLDATGKVQGVYAICKSHSFLCFRKQFTKFALDFKTIWPKIDFSAIEPAEVTIFHSRVIPPACRTSSWYEHKQVRNLSGYRGRTPLSVVQRLGAFRPAIRRD